MQEINSLTAEEKVGLYSLAKNLFISGKSHPQVMEELVKFCSPDYAEIIAEKGLNESWDSLFKTAKDLFGQDKTYSQVIELLKQHESDNDIVNFAANLWYKVKTVEMENIVESSTNIFIGIREVLIFGLSLPFIFIFRFSLIAKILWIIAFVLALLKYLYGLHQRSLSNKIKKFMKDGHDI